MARRKPRPDVVECPDCKGTGKVKRWVVEVICSSCNGVGWIEVDNGTFQRKL